MALIIAFTGVACISALSPSNAFRLAAEPPGKRDAVPMSPFGCG